MLGENSSLEEALKKKGEGELKKIESFSKGISITTFNASFDASLDKAKDFSFPQQI
jgi:hypothetical protein